MNEQFHDQIDAARPSSRKPRFEMPCYTSKKDKLVKNAWPEDCVSEWPPYHEEKVRVTRDFNASHFASITPEDGKKETTYNHMPLWSLAKP